MNRLGKLRFNWRLMLMQTVVNALALGLTVLILPSIHMLAENLLLELLISGFIFGLLNAFVRPILQFIMFRFLFITFGLVLIVINFVMLWLLGWITPGWFQADGLLAIFFAAVLVGVFGVLLETLLGLQPPIVDDEGGGVTHKNVLSPSVEQLLTPALAGTEADVPSQDVQGDAA